MIKGILAFLFFVLTISLEKANATLGLDEAQKFAIEKNLEVLSLRQAVEEAKAKQGRARSKYLPKIGIAGGGDTQIASTGTQNSLLGYTYGEYNLFNGFEDTYQSEIASLATEKSEIRLKRAEFRIGLDVERVFHTYIFKKKTLELKNEALKLNENHKQMAALKRRSGLSADSDVMEFDIRESTLRSDIALLEQELDETRNNLKKLLGDEVGSKVEPIGVLQHQHLKSSLSDLTNRLKNESESVQIAIKDLAVSSLENKIAGAKWLPKIDLEVAAGYLPWDLRQVPAGSPMFGGKIVAKLDLFSGFDTLYERRETEANRLKQDAELKQSILTAITDTQNAFRRIHAIQQRVDLEEENQARARKYYASVMSEYRRGVKNSADLRVAADSVFDTELRRESYKYDFLNSRIDLERALGGKVETELVHE